MADLMTGGGDEHQITGYGQILRHPGGIDLTDNGQKLHRRHLGQSRRRYLDHQISVTLGYLQAKARLALRIGHGRGGGEEDGVALL